MVRRVFATRCSVWFTGVKSDEGTTRVELEEEVGETISYTLQLYKIWLGQI